MAAEEQTNEPGEELTFGQHLKMLRTQKGIDLRTISDETKIAVSTLQLMEEEAYDKLPDTVFVKGFLRAYAKVVNASPEMIIKSYLSGRHHYDELRRLEAGLSGSHRFLSPRLLAILVIFVFVAYAAIWGIKTRSVNESPEIDMPKAEADVAPNAESPAATDLQNSVETPESQTGYLLQINAVEETWLKIIVDRQAPKEYLLNPGDRLELRATSGFNLLIGNATGINLQLNHRPIAIDGQHGQVVTLKLPR